MRDIYFDATAALYEAAVLPEQWPAALAMVSEVVQGRFTHLFLTDVSSGQVTMSALGALPGQDPDPAGEASYISYFSRLDPRLPAIARFPLGRAVSCTELVNADTVRRSEFFNDFFLPHGVRWTALANFDAGRGTAGTCGVLRRPSAPAFDVDDMARFQAMLGHIARATKLQKRLEQASVSGTLAVAAWHRSSTVMIVVNRAAKMLFANKAAEAVLERGESLRVKGGKLGVVSPGSEQQLLAGIAAALPLGRSGRGGVAGAVRILGATGGVGLTLLVAPLPSKAVGGSHWHGPAALILAREPDRPALLSGRHLIDWFGLSQAEASLTIDLADGRRPEEIAAARGVKISTVRSQISSILAKTGSARQSDLIGLLGQLPTF